MATMFRLWCTIALVACGSPGTNGDGESATPDRDVDASEATPPDALDEPSPTYCIMACEVDADCCPPGAANCPGAYPMSWSCEDGLCAFGGCTDDEQCTFGGIVQGMECHPVAGIGACFAPCSSDTDCAPTGGTCTGKADDGARMCQVAAAGCASDADCNGLGSCNDGACTCVSADECTAAAPGAKGWGCGEVPVYSGDGGSTTDCTSAGCPAGKTCNPITKVCDQDALRDDCNTTGCSDGEVCDPIEGVCVAAPEGECSPACGGATPICSDGRCVQCEQRGDCDDGQSCDAASGTCSGVECTEPTPLLWQGQCVACGVDAHCQPGESCSQSTNTCVPAGCGSCVDPYPVCVRSGVDAVCVECTTDVDCDPGDVCNPTTYACERGTSSERCRTDADCVPGTSGTPACDVSSGLCYAREGVCDASTSCVGTDGTVEDCVSSEVLGVGGTSGVCGCSYTDPANPQLGSNCRAGTCIDLASLLALLGGQPLPSGAPSNVCFEL